ncbi:13748_t:CDS:2 [Funneliformis caledonium]|uniref:13748_t:CDS:1 n=1 Tax=Funneliformis caledonium TaxID=1117310 RepID=A0A9N8YMJ8_9GLOM|nr:13748_t:CDS:2 [Funneliformis caledonium]
MVTSVIIGIGKLKYFVFLQLSNCYLSSKYHLVDFGTSSSTFAYSHKSDNGSSEIVTNDIWPQEGQHGVFKTNTVLLYNTQTWKVVGWGSSAITRQEKKKKKNNFLTDNGLDPTIPVSLFKLHFGNIREQDKPILPQGLDYRRCVIDYLAEMTKLIKNTIATRWPGINFYRNVLIVLTVPSDFSEAAKATMRECAWRAGLLEFANSPNLEFTTEPEAAAVHCITSLGRLGLKAKANFMIVDCGGGAVELTMRRLITHNQISEITERTGDYCGSTFVDKEFLSFLYQKYNLYQPIQQLYYHHNDQFQYLLREFCSKVKLSFTGNPSDFQNAYIDLEDACPNLIYYVNDEMTRQRMELEEWIIELDFVNVKKMFDRVIQRINWLIGNQLNSFRQQCSAIFLVGGFSESLYLVRSVKHAFSQQVPIIEVPSQPITAVVRGAVKYGLNMRTIQTRILRYTYGVQVLKKWKKGEDPQRKLPNGLMLAFHLLAKRGTEVKVNQTFGYMAKPTNSNQVDMRFNIYVTTNFDAKYCDEPGTKLLGTLKVDLPDKQFCSKRKVEFDLTFGTMEIKATARNKKSGLVYQTTLNLDF